MEAIIAADRLMPERLPSVLAGLLEPLAPEPLRAWAAKLVRRGLPKPEAIEAISTYYVTLDQELARHASEPRDTLVVPARRKAREHDGDWSGPCLGCMSDHAFREATGQELARLVRFVLSPLEWRSLAADAASRLTGASSRFFTCTKCDFLVRVCMRCQEVCRAGDAACAGCGRVFHGSKS